jgi:tetratricopeptide (TPR) repeat protein
MCLLQRTSFPLLLAFSFCTAASLLPAQGFVDRPVIGARDDRRHEDPQWESVQKHLPDPATSAPKKLEEQADLLRVRRFPEDALDYYQFALRRGGDSATLRNKIGLTELELRNIVLAEAYFRQAIKLDRKNSQSWNNLAATEYLERQYGSAVSDYKKAVKLNQANAIYHANLSTAYFELKNFNKARHEADTALKIDPLVYLHGSGAGVSAHVLSVEDRGRFAYEMAKLYARHGQEEEMLHQLAMACENGFDILTNMGKDPELVKYRADSRVVLLVEAAKMLHPNAGTLGSTASIKGAAPALPNVP